MKIEIDHCYNMDCLDLMRAMKEQGIKADWCITDPPYGIGIEKMSFTNGSDKLYTSATVKRDYSSVGNWDSIRIEKNYFDLIKEVSAEQIIFGGNYYTDFLQATKS